MRQEGPPLVRTPVMTRSAPSALLVGLAIQPSRFGV
ncbi:uncharacterized protein METZ01_LOCUS19186 [marine metagenome]|uniref:Uncharacterized protein n=1 Tax=marine metagenome TaxID=408172 RepID=A0A381PH75_9ZZZZ